MPDWLNHAAVAASRNGTADHTVAPDGTGGSVVAGSAFTPAAGRLLVVFVEGSVTSSTPAGWTLPTDGSAVNNTGLYVWHRNAAGSDTLTTTHNASDYPGLFDFYEFSTGSTFVGSATATGVAYNGGGGPTLAGLTGTNWTAGIVGQGQPNGATSATFTWDIGTELTDTFEPFSVTDGYGYSLTATDGNTASSAAYAATGDYGGLTVERLVVAVNVAAAEPPPTYAQLRPSVIAP